MQFLTRRRHHHTGRASVGWWSGLLVGALLAVQCLALAHRIDHAPGLAAVAGESAQGHPAGGNECRLLDAVGLADALHSSLAVAQALPGGDTACSAPWCGAQPRSPARPYQARAPPQA